MISYKPLLKLLIDRDIKKGELIEDANISWSTMSKINKNEKISLDVIDRLCAALNVQPGQLIEYIPDKKEEDKLNE